MTSTPAPALDEIQLSDLDLWTGPIEVRDAAFARLRAERPIAPMKLPALPHMGLPEGEYWALTRHADIIHAGRHPELFCSGRGFMIADMPPSFVEYFGSMIGMDDPQHARLRRIVSRGFTPRQLEKMRSDVEETAAGIVDEIIERGECDFVTEVAALLPLRIIVDMMGIPRSEERFIFDRTNIILGGTDPEYVPEQDNPEAIAAALLTAGAELGNMVEELANERVREPRNDLVTVLVTSEIDGEHLSPQELASF